MLNKHLYNFVQDVLNDVISNGFSGKHNLMITFVTKHINVVISDKLRSAYPEELTIILDEEFYNLKTNDDGFSVSLVFDETGSEEIFVPYASILALEDQSCDFSVDFEPDLSNIKVNSNNVIAFNDIKRVK